MPLSIRRVLAPFALVLVLAASAPAAAPTRYNVLLVSIDSLRRDAVGCYGATLLHGPHVSPTPNLDHIAATGVRLADAYANSPWTLPSHVSLFVGQPPVVHQVETDLHTLDARFPTLTEILHDVGYRTAGVFSGPYLEPSWGFGRGFDRYRAMYGDAVATASRALARLDADIAAAHAAGEREREESLRWDRRRDYESVRALSHADVNSDRVTEAALADLDELAASPAPWFAFVHYFDVHYDYVPPAPWDTRFDPDYRGTITGRGYLDNSAIAENDPTTMGAFVRRIGERDLEHVRALYAGEAGWVDSHVGRLLAWLAAHQLDRKTLVIVVSDHGDEFFEHGGIAHRRTVGEEVLQIPLLFRLPGVLPAGRAAPGLVTLADVLPTILDILGLPARGDLAGRSMLGMLRGDDDGATRAVMARLVRFYDETAHFDATRGVSVRLATVQEAFRTATLKVVRRRAWPLVPPGLAGSDLTRLRAAAHDAFRQETLQWIDLARSPRDETAAYSTDFSSARAHAALEAFRTRYREVRGRVGPLTPAAPSAELRSALEGLGYVDEETPISPRRGFSLPPPGTPAPAQSGTQ
jgi:arylsulfatase A-like enzyme